MGDDASREAEREWLRMTAEDVLGKVAEGRARFGPMTPEDVDRSMATFADQLRQSGRVALADRFLAAWNHYGHAGRTLQQVLDQLQPALVAQGNLTPEQRARQDEARDAYLAAEEQFERLIAEATTET